MSRYNQQKQAIVTSAALKRKTSLRLEKGLGGVTKCRISILNILDCFYLLSVSSNNSASVLGAKSLAQSLQRYLCTLPTLRHLQPSLITFSDLHLGQFISTYYSTFPRNVNGFPLRAGIGTSSNLIICPTVFKTDSPSCRKGGQRNNKLALINLLT